MRGTDGMELRMELGNVGETPPRSSQGSGSGGSACEIEEDGEQLRLLHSSSPLISEDGKTPLLQHKKTHKQHLLRTLQQVLMFLAAHWPKLLKAAIILGLAITGIVLLSIKGFAFFGSILNWFKRHSGWGGWGIFVGVYTALVSLFLPGVIFIMGAGFVFGFWRGLLAVWIGGAVGQALAFLLARYLLRDWVEATVQKWKRWKYIDKAIETEGWKLVLIMRCSPVIPYNLLNIAIATTSMHFWQFAIVSAVGIIFECSVFTYVGSTADNIASIISGEAGPPKALQWVLLGLGLFFAVAAAFGVSLMIRRAVRRAEDVGDSNSSNLEGLGPPEGLERRSLLASPSSLEREGFVSSINGHGRVPEGRSAVFELKPVTTTPERPLSRGSGKAKSSPRYALNAAPSTPFSKTMQDGRGDLELGQGVVASAPMSASRRRASLRTDSDDEL